jgi:hypothetical protein
MLVQLYTLRLEKVSGGGSNMARHGLRHTSKCSNFMLSMRWYLQKLHFNVYVYMATWVGHTLKKLLPPLLEKVIG